MLYRKREKKEKSMQIILNLYLLYLICWRITILTDQMIMNNIKKNVKSFVNNKERNENGKDVDKCLDQGRDRDPYPDPGLDLDLVRVHVHVHAHVHLILRIILDLKVLNVS